MESMDSCLIFTREGIEENQQHHIENFERKKIRLKKGLELLTSILGDTDGP